MSTEAALLGAIRSALDDDTARLVYADFVEEDGDPARAEFIRAQVQLARLASDDPRRPALEGREHELLAEHEAGWLRVPPDATGLTGWRFERGFLTEVAATPLFMLGPGADLGAAHPIRRWRVQSSQADMADDLITAGQQGWFSRLEAVDLSGWYESIGQLERFLTRSDFAGLRELDLTDRPGLDDLPGILGRARFGEQLKVLRCGGRYPGEVGQLDAGDLARVLEPARLTELAVPNCQHTAQDVRGLLVADCCRELTTLSIRDNPIEADGWDGFRAARCRLRELDLSGTPLGAISLGEVLGSAAAADLRVLHFNRCGSARDNIPALAASRFWTQAEELRMRDGSIPAHHLGALLASDGPPALRVLDVAGNWVRDAGVAELCQARWAESLTHLDLSRNYLTDAALRTLAGSGRFPRLRNLRLDGNNPSQDGAERHEAVTDTGVFALAECPALAGLRVLGLNETTVTAAGIDAALNGRYWELTGLGVGACRLSEVAVGVLAGSPRLGRLTWLDLSANPVGPGGVGLRPLAESEYLSPLCELDVRGCQPNPAIRAALRARLGTRLRE